MIKYIILSRPDNLGTKWRRLFIVWAESGHEALADMYPDILNGDKKSRTGYGTTELWAIPLGDMYSIVSPEHITGGAPHDYTYEWTHVIDTNFGVPIFLYVEDGIVIQPADPNSRLGKKFVGLTIGAVKSICKRRLKGYWVKRVEHGQIYNWRKHAAAKKMHKQAAT